jgi:hypothetical protein
MASSCRMAGPVSGPRMQASIWWPPSVPVLMLAATTQSALSTRREGLPCWSARDPTVSMRPRYGIC